MRLVHLEEHIKELELNSSRDREESEVRKRATEEKLQEKMEELSKDEGVGERTVYKNGRRVGRT